MNRKGFIDFDEFSPGMILLPIIGALMGIFTASGGFSGMFSDVETTTSLGTKLISAIGGAVIGFIVAYFMSNQ